MHSAMSVVRPLLAFGARRAAVIAGVLGLAAGIAAAQPGEPKSKAMPDEVRRAQVEKVYDQRRLPPPTDPANEIVYGSDDRLDQFEVSDPFLRELGEAVCIITFAGNLINNGDGTYSLSGFQRWNSQSGLSLCEGVRFQDQLRFGFCTGFLVGPDLVATAGHCVDGDVSGLAYIFDFNQSGPNTRSPGGDEIDPSRIPAASVYFAGQADPVKQRLADDDDYGVVKLDRPVRTADDSGERIPLTIRREGELSLGEPLLVIGHGNVLPKKYDSGGTVKTSDVAKPFFAANLDTFGGNSGSPVINALTGQVEGILVRGNSDWDTTAGCTKPKVCPETGCATTSPFEEISRISTVADVIPFGGLQITPTFGTLHLASSGVLTPESVEYTITNPSSAAASYSIEFVDAPVTFDLLVDPAGDQAGSVAANSSKNVTINVAPSWLTLNPGKYTRTVRFNDLTSSTSTTRVHTIEIETTGFTVSPRTGVRAVGPVGGPLLPGGPFTYTVRSTRPTPLSVVVYSDVPWLEVDGESFVVINLNGVGDSASIQATIDPEAFPGQGLYSTALNFINLSGSEDSTTRAFTAEIGRSTLAAADVPKVVADMSTVTSFITVPSGFCLADVDVGVDITHSAIGDLVVSLTSPWGEVVRLHNNTGGIGDSLLATYDQSGSPGSIRPDGPGNLDSYNNYPAAGTWTLTVTDNVPGDSGVLNGWNLRLLPKLGCTPYARPGSTELTHTLTQTLTLDGESFVGEPLSYTIVSLPVHGTLIDPNFGPITAVPYTVNNTPAQTLWISPAPGYLGSDEFQFTVADSTGSSEPAVQSLSIGIPQEIVSFPLDSNPGWLFTGQWTFGVPTGQGSDPFDPTSGFTGFNVYGYNLAGDYPDNLTSPQRLISGTIDLSGYTFSSVNFQRWLAIENGNFDKARFEYSADNGLTWSNLWVHDVGSPTLLDDQWKAVGYPLPASAIDNAQVRVRWSIGPTDESNAYPGWNIDDVVFAGVRIPIAPCTTDFNQDDTIDFSDFLAFFNAFDTGDPVGDINADGAVDFSDFLFFFNAFDSGVCPS